MGPVSATVTVDAPRERLFGFLTDVYRRPAITDHFMGRYHPLSLERSGQGSGARFELDTPFHGLWADSTIVECRPPHLIREEGRCGRSNRIPTRTVFELVEEAGGMTRVTVSFWTEPWYVLDKVKERFWPAGWHRRQWRRALERLRELAEQDRLGEVEPLRLAGRNPLLTGVP